MTAESRKPVGQGLQGACQVRRESLRLSLRQRAPVGDGLLSAFEGLLVTAESASLLAKVCRERARYGVKASGLVCASERQMATASLARRGPPRGGRGRQACWPRSARSGSDTE